MSSKTRTAPIWLALTHGRQPWRLAAPWVIPLHGMLVYKTPSSGAPIDHHDPHPPAPSPTRRCRPVPRPHPAPDGRAATRGGQWTPTRRGGADCAAWPSGLVRQRGRARPGQWRSHAARQHLSHLLHDQTGGLSRRDDADGARAVAAERPGRPAPAGICAPASAYRERPGPPHATRHGARPAAPHRRADL